MVQTPLFPPVPVVALPPPPQATISTALVVHNTQAKGPVLVIVYSPVVDRVRDDSNTEAAGPPRGAGLSHLSSALFRRRRSRSRSGCCTGLRLAQGERAADDYDLILGVVV